MTRSPAFTPLASAPTASTSPANSRPSTAPGPPALPCMRPEAMITSARLRPAARTRTSTWLGAGAGLATSRISTPASAITAAFMMQRPPTCCRTLARRTRAVADRLGIFQVEVPGKIDPRVLRHLGYEGMAHRRACRFGVDGGEMRVGQHLAHDPGGLAGVGQVVDQKDALAPAV